MKSFWALPALLRVAIAAQKTFSVQDDVLAFPQYQVDFTREYVSELQAQSRLNGDDELYTDIETETETETETDSNQDLSLVSSDEHGRKSKTQYEYDELVLTGQRYLCQIPRVADQQPASQAVNETLSKQDQEKELARANDRGWQLLRGMQGNCIYFWSGWWSYRYCYGQGVKQFHQLPPSQGVPAYPPVEDPGVPGFMLGAVSDPKPDAKAEANAKAVGKLETRGESRYLVQRLGGGTLCDLTGRPRRIEVQFHCNPATSDRISLIKEIATCAYLMVIQTPRLCNDIAFLPPQKDRANKVSCSPILTHEQIPGYEAELAAASELLAQDIPNPFADPQSKAPPSVGDIILGARKWVPEGQKIEKSGIVGGGKETLVETIADSFGKVMSPEELKKMGLGDAKSVEKLKKEIEKIAGGQGWKLEVYDTPQGREYRGVLLGDEVEDTAEKEGGKEKDTKSEDGEAEQQSEPEQEREREQEQASEGSEETYKDEL